LEEETKPRITRKSPLRAVVKLCPKCLHKLNRGSKLGGWLIPQDYICPNCGYRGFVFIERRDEGSVAKE
jgi:predicted RNA-binding Zn-ribbon protein involved in translation (DUF1610 family)